MAQEFTQTYETVLGNSGISCFIKRKNVNARLIESDGKLIIDTLLSSESGSENLLERIKPNK